MHLYCFPSLFTKRAKSEFFTNDEQGELPPLARLLFIGLWGLSDLLKKAPIIREAFSMVCIDDFAIRKRESYGTIMVDIETHRVIDLIPSREGKNVVEWLKTYPNLNVISRDGSITYRVSQGGINIFNPCHYH